MARHFFLFFCCFWFIVACAPRKTNVTPSPEATRPKQKASQKPYIVYGQQYEPLESHQGFTQTGVASWYGKDFHGRKTSNGEKYDMNAMTAAHKTLPLGVFVKVRNRANGQEAIVRVNDRGPFVKGRIIDLSYAAAKKLGVDRAGTAPVKITALGYRGNDDNNYNEPENYDVGVYTVQVGSFKEYRNARRLSEEMKKQTGFSDIYPTKVNKDNFYRVYAGKHSSLQAAERAEKDFAEHGRPGSFVVSLD